MTSQINGDYDGATSFEVAEKEPNYIRDCIASMFDPESAVKFQQVLEYINQVYWEPLYKTYNAELMGILSLYETEAYRMEQIFLTLKVKFFSFRYIHQIGKIIVERLYSGDDKAEEKFITIIKILLFHAMTAKSCTANLALVELDQLCHVRGITLQSLYNTHRAKFLRLIIKAILYKLNNSEPSNRTNVVITYMTRALEVFNVTSITKEDVAQSLIIITNLIHKENYNASIEKFLNYLARYQNLDVYSLIRCHIQSIVINLLLKRKLSSYDMTASLTKLGSFCDKSPSELLDTKFTFIKARLILNYSSNPKSVTDAFYYLSKFELKEAEQPFEDELEDEENFIAYVNPSMIGILLGVDSHFTANRSTLGSKESIEHIEGLCKLLSLLNREQVQHIHVKLLSTLSLLLCLRPRRDDQSLNRALKGLWAVFVAKLTKELKMSLVINICVALYDLVEDCPEEVADIYKDLICRQDLESLQNKLKSLFFIPNVPPLKEVYSFLTPYVRRENALPNLQEFHKTLGCVLPLMKFENQKSRLIAIDRIKQLLKVNQEMLTSNMLVNTDEPLDDLTSKTIESLIALSSTRDPECTPLIAECLGIVGAINPIRLDHLIYGEISGSYPVVKHLSEVEFVVDLIERLKNSLFSDQRSESETANYALQVVVEKYKIFECNIVESLSIEARRACSLCKNTRYIGEKKAQPDCTSSVFEKFKQDHHYSYADWLDKFASNVILSIGDKKIQEVLDACTYVFRYNIKLAEHLLSYAIIHIVEQKESGVQIILKEIMAIIDENVDVSTQDLDCVYSKSSRGSLQTLHFQCANMLFCILDTTNRLKSDKKKKPHPNDHSQDMKAFLSSIPKDRLAILATKCRSYARALCYFEEYLFENKREFDKYANTLQRIYVALDDTYEAPGVEMVRTSPTTISDNITNFEACGRFDKAFICCDTQLSVTDCATKQEQLIDDALRCLSNQGDYQRIYEKSKQLLGQYSQYKQNILPYAIEATWKLGRWDEFDRTFDSQQLENFLDATCVSQAYLIKALNESSDIVREKLKVVRSRLMKPLSIAMMDHTAYFRGYQNLLGFHMIEDFASSMKIFENEQPDTLERDLESLFDLWNKRNKLVQPTLKSLEPLLIWQRSIGSIISRRFTMLQDKVTVDIGQRWLASADSAREAASFDRAFFCLTQAQRWFGSDFEKLSLDLRVKYHIGQAKLAWEQGEKTAAIRGLKISLNRLNNHGLHIHLEDRAKRLKREYQLACGKQSNDGSKKVTAEKDPFPSLTNIGKCGQCEVFKLKERKSFAELRLLLTHYCDEAAGAIPETLFFMYEECVHLGVNQEEIFFRLARYYDKLLTYYIENPTLCSGKDEEEKEKEKNMYESTQKFSQNLISGDTEEVYSKLMQHSIIAFGNSLKYGVRYIRESMPRLLNIWYDLGTKKTKAGQAIPRNVSSRIENTIRFIDELKRVIPAYYFMPALSLLQSRVCHPHSGISKKTCEILMMLLDKFPHQMCWHMIAMFNDDQEDRKRVGKALLLGQRKTRPPAAEKIIKDTLEFSRAIRELCYNFTPHHETKEGGRSGRKKKLSDPPLVSEISPLAAKFSFEKCKVMAPIQSNIRAIIPLDNVNENLEKHEAFPEHNISYIRALAPTVRVFKSLQEPRAILVKLHNGQTVSILCKAGDDLRKDSRCVEFLNLLNRTLKKDNQSNARFFEMQTFLVLPIELNLGLIEMVPNLVPLKHAIEALYKEKDPKFSFFLGGLQKEQQKYASNLIEMQHCFETKILSQVTPAVLPTWFLRKFNEPTSWYMARLAYTRTLAVSSMGGYIIGLGDRHLDNILIDTSNGRVIHVDFNLLFHQGEYLPTPERVPFRLTNNLQAALGSVKTEGNFRKVCEITMRVMRKEKDALLTTLKPFLHDPCTDWTKNRDYKIRPDPEDKHSGNKMAKVRIEIIERKLKGFPRSKQFKPLTLIDSYSVEAQVDNLIEEATDTFNLAPMWHGWCPHI